MAASKTLYLGTFVHSKALDELEYLHGAAICVDESGTIAAVERECDEAKAKQTVLPRLGWSEADVAVVRAKDGQFFFPGFIDTHLHAPQYPNMGIFGKSTLLDWLHTYTFPLEASLADPAKARRVYTRVIRKTLSHGTTCAAYYATIDVATTNLLADLCLAAGQRALVGRVCMDQLSPDYYRDASADAALAATRASIAHIQAADPSMALVRPVITPRFAPSCSFPLLRDLGALAAATGLPVQTHISENRDEVALVRRMFPPAITGVAAAAAAEEEEEDEEEEEGEPSSYAAVYDAAGLLTERTILAHAVHLTAGEAALVAARRAKVSHCPCSNSALASGAARVRWLLDRGVACGLGTDVSGGYSPSVLQAARAAVLVSRHVALDAAVAAAAAAAGKRARVEAKAKVEAEAQAEAAGTGGGGGGDAGDTAAENNGDAGATAADSDGDAEDKAAAAAAERQKLSVDEVLYLATRGGAEVVGLENKVGGFEVGKEWDAQLVGLGAVGEDGEVIRGDGDDDDDDGDVDVFGWESWPERVAKWVYNGDDRNTKRVWVKGRLVHQRK